MFRYLDESAVTVELMYDLLQTGVGSPVQHPDLLSKEPVIPGKVKLVIDDQEINSKPITSLLLENPTWKDILQEGNHMLKHCQTPIGFLEAIVPIDAGTYQLKFAH
jgi:hypothetical protein